MKNAIEVPPILRTEKYLKRSYSIVGRDEIPNMLHLTCHADKVEMYKKFGFVDMGIANSTWGGSKWHEMTCEICFKSNLL